MDAATRFDTRIVGALPVITRYLERLNMAQIINDLVPWEGKVPLGTLVEVLVTNRLLQPKAMFKIDDWAQKAGVTDFHGLEAGQLHDDRLGRALERLPAHAERIQAALVLQAVKQFKLKVPQIHYDITGVELYGAYDIATPEGQPPPTPLPTYGHTKSGRKHVKQVQLGVNVSGDGGVPVAHAAFDGNTAETNTHLDNLRRLGAVLPKKWELYIADSKLDTPENLLAVAAAGHFLCAGAFNTDLQQLFLQHDRQLHPIEYCPKSKEHLPPEQRDQYRAFELPARLEGTVAGRKQTLAYRQIFVWNETKQRQDAATRERHMAKIREEFATVEKNLNKYNLKTEEVVCRRLEAARARYAEGKLFTYQLSRQRSGTLQLEWQLDAKALAERQRLEGVYLLKTNLRKKGCPIPRLLYKYKEQTQVERRIHHLKGPLAVAPMFLEKPERIAGLLCILVWALMVLALMERQVRRGLKGKALYGLYPENRPSPAPTGPALLECFSTLCLVIIKHRGNVSHRLADPSDIQRRLLLLLGIPPDELKAFKRRYGLKDIGSLGSS